MSLLSISRLAASYGPSQALFDISLSVAPGETVALMGRNGMGKSTTVKCICGMMGFSGDITLDGKALTNLPSHTVARLGIGLVPEGRRCFPNLTVVENLICAARPGMWSLAGVLDLFPRLGERQGQLAGSLSGGEQQMLAIGRALMTNPRLLILDEATEGLAPLIRREIWRVIGDLKASSGLSIIVIDKSIRELRTICDQAVIIERGKTVWSGAMGSLTNRTTERYLGV